jgi:glycogen operon protein
MPKAVLDAAVLAAPPPVIAGPRILYELHVRGFTMLHPEIPREIRGTFAGLAHPAVIAHLQRLGVSHVELLPVAAGIEERHLPPLGLTNYWNYNPVGWLAPDPRLAPGGMAEVRAAVAALRAAGIGVILDVVLNHSGEGDAQGPTVSLRGLGEAAWYRPGANDAGCGNVLALDKPWPLRLAMDALRHWVLAAGVDGFRLDLATTLGRRGTGFDADAPLLLAMRQDPVLRDRIIIAEPWDLGPGGHRTGQFPAGWGEWNDRFRDDVRRFWRGDAGMLGALATRLAGSTDLFPPAKSVNFVTAHDGFTLADLVAFTRKRNAANGEQNRDGTDDNLSWNGGAEGPTDDPIVLARRRGDVRALLATLLLARGVPMLAMGDEAGRTQGGNNNAYAQDNAISWLDWQAMDQDLLAFTAALVAARRTHPALNATAPLAPETVAWLRPDGGPADWHAPAARALVMLLLGDERVAIAVNGGDAPVALTLPTRPGHAWQVLADSAGGEGMLAPHSLRLLAERPRARRAEDPTLLPRLARAAGIATDWQDLTGATHVVPPETLVTILGALGLPAATAADRRDSLARLSAPRALPRHAGGPTLAVQADGPVELHIALEDGTTLRHVADGTPEPAPQPDGGVQWQRRIALPALPPGRHRVRLGEAERALTIAPPACHLPETGRLFGIAAQLYALRRAGDPGIGDYAALGLLARDAAAAGAGLVGISPPHALHPIDRERASPYQPADRRFLEPALIEVPGLPAAPGALVDYPRVWQAKRAALQAICQPSDPAFAAFRAEQGEALQRFATYCAVAEHLGHTDLARWPAYSPALAAQHAEAVGFHAWLQYTADRQLAAAARAGAPLYRDLAVGAAPDGAERWSAPERFLDGLSIGAPPDAFAPEGQVWGLPAPHPDHAPGHLAELLRANMRHAAALRIDHVMGLARLFLVPAGAPGSAGAYLHYPLPAMLRTLALESQRARCMVIGEDLGTVPPGFRAELRTRRVLSYRVLWFERDGPGFIPPQHWPAEAAACVSTHDLPTLRGWWQGEDIAEREALGLLTPEAAAAARAERAEDRARLLAALDLPPEEALPAAAIHGHVAGAPSRILMIQAEDLAGETIAVNLPGTDRERPNWRRRLPVAVETLLEAPQARAILAAIRAERG